MEFTYFEFLPFWCKKESTATRMVKEGALALLWDIVDRIEQCQNDDNKLIELRRTIVEIVANLASFGTLSMKSFTSSLPSFPLLSFYQPLIVSFPACIFLGIGIQMHTR